MRFKKPFKAVPIRPDPAYLEKRAKRRGRPPTLSTPHCRIEAEQHADNTQVIDDTAIPKLRTEAAQRDRVSAPINYRYKPWRRKGGAVSIILVGAAIVGAIGGVGSVALENAGLSRLREIAVAVGIVRAREPQSGDYWSSCNAARAAGTAPIYAREPGYRPEIDGDFDGIACEPYREN